MGLDIHGEKTGKHINFGYTQFRYAVLSLTLNYCDAPIDIGLKKGDENVDPTHFLLFPCIPLYEINENDFYDFTLQNKFQKYLHSIMSMGHVFPNLLFHSDVCGHYSKKGKVNLRTYKTGNSIKLLKELNHLLEYFKDDKKFEFQLKIMTEFRDLVKYEIENGNGKILFG